MRAQPKWTDISGRRKSVLVNPKLLGQTPPQVFCVPLARAAGAPRELFPVRETATGERKGSTRSKWPALYGPGKLISAYFDSAVSSLIFFFVHSSSLPVFARLPLSLALLVKQSCPQLPRKSVKKKKRKAYTYPDAARARSRHQRVTRCSGRKTQLFF